MKVKTTIVIGLDGAHFELINPWIRQGYLPNIKSLIEDGVSGDMLSCLPPVTSPNWKCYSTGKNPGKLGIFWWENIDVENRRVYYPYDRKNEQREIWDYLSEAGYKVCVIGTPLTYPPKKVNGVMISGGLDAEEQAFTYPGDLEKELKEKYDYRVHPAWMIERDKEKAVKDILELIRLRFRVVADLMDKDDFDFVQVTTFYLNVLHHFLWDDAATRKAWQIVDDYVGRFADDKTNLILMSDHGSNPVECVFNINTWLHQEGYLAYNLGHNLTQSLFRLGITRKNLVELANRLRLKKTVLKTIAPERLMSVIPLAGGEVKKEAKAFNVNWRKTEAIASGQGPVYVLNKEKVGEIKERLLRLRRPDGKRIATMVFEKHEIYSGSYLAEAPDLIIDQAANIHIKGAVGDRGVFESPKRWKADNKKQALFIAKGPGFPQGKRLEDISILDLAPTILRLYGLSTPIDMDGEDIGRKWIES